MSELEKIAEETVEELLAYVRGEDEEGISIEEYLADYCIEVYTYRYGTEFAGVFATHSFGGPNVYVDTLRRCVEVDYVKEHLIYPLPVEIAEAIDEVCRELY